MLNPDAEASIIAYRDEVTESSRDPNKRAEHLEFASESHQESPSEYTEDNLNSLSEETDESNGHLNRRPSLLESTHTSACGVTHRTSSGCANPITVDQPVLLESVVASTCDVISKPPMAKTTCFSQKKVEKTDKPNLTKANENKALNLLSHCMEQYTQLHQIIQVVANAERLSSGPTSRVPVDGDEVVSPKTTLGVTSSARKVSIDSLDQRAECSCPCLAMQSYSLTTSAFDGIYHEIDAVFRGAHDASDSSIRLRALIHHLDTRFSDYMRNNGKEKKTTDQNSIGDPNSKEESEEEQMILTESKMMNWVKGMSSIH
ncbi:MAG: hypothetical protein M1827_006725 [Pycnora praestabilis]|nr:MAG: hypothetical protein M1827_006725 [Pycnora praestabilis]